MPGYELVPALKLVEVPLVINRFWAVAVPVAEISKSTGSKKKNAWNLLEQRAEMVGFRIEKEIGWFFKLGITTDPTPATGHIAVRICI